MRIVPFMPHDRDDLYSNTYVLIDDKNDCVVIDPAIDNDGITDYIKSNSLNLKAVLLTHAHYDHMRGVTRLLNLFNVPLYVGFDDEDSLKDPKKNCSRWSKQKVIIKTKPILLADKEKISLLDENINVIYTPFHTAGSLCYYLEKSKMLISGDTLFRGCIGRTDLPTSKPAMQCESLNKLKELPDDVRVYPGHGLVTTIKIEKTGNGFLK